MPPPKARRDDERDKQTRIAVVHADRCRPSRCGLECMRCCPINMQGRQCIEVTSTSKITSISEELCIGCGLCVKKCPFAAIQIINIPSNLDRETTHRFGRNSFKLHRLPLPRPGKVLGLIGANGTGKSTALNILKGQIKPNLGHYRDEPSWEDILRHFRGSEHQAYFQNLVEGRLRALMKPQFVDKVPTVVKGTVRELLAKGDERDSMHQYVTELQLEDVLDTPIDKLSGGELQRFTIAALCIQNATVYMFDEPSSYLDVKQRLTAARVIRGMVRPDNYIVVVEHDLSVVDYMSDFSCVLYGSPGVYGIVTFPYGVREGINVFLDGFVPTENLRFRTESLSFRMADDLEERAQRVQSYTYPKLTKKIQRFTLNVEAGAFNDSEIVVLLGQNGCGKTTLIRMLAGYEKSDDPDVTVPKLQVSYKPQKISPKFQGSVKDLLETKILKAFNHPQFQIDVLKPLSIVELLDKEVQHLSGGQLQRVGLCVALGTPAKVYLIDEPSAYLDSDQRIIAARVIKRFILHAKATAFVVEHDFIMATYLADRVIVYSGTPARDCTAHAPTGLLDGMNTFLKQLEVTFRRDPSNYRPRINKHGSVKDRLQKAGGHYFYMVDQPIGGARAAADGDDDDDE